MTTATTTSYFARIHSLKSFAECSAYAAELTERTGQNPSF